MSGRDERDHTCTAAGRRGPGDGLPAGAGPTAAALAFLALPVILAAPAALSAQEAGGGERIDTPYRWIERGFRAGPYGGWVAADRGEINLGPGPSAVFGGRLRARISSPLSLEANIGFGSADRWVVDPRPESDAGLAAVDTVGLDWAILQGAMQFALTGSRTWHGLQPYALVGAGLVIGVSEETSGVFEGSDLQQFGYELNSAPVVQAGLGFEWLVSDRFGLGFEVRDHLWRITTPDGFFQTDVIERIEDLGLPAPRDSDWTHNLEFSVTLWRYF